MMTYKKLGDRINELKGIETFPTQFDALEAWVFTVDKVIQDIYKTSLNPDDRKIRMQQLVDKLFTNE